MRALVAHKDLNDDADESEDNEYFDKKDIDNYHEWLGKGPYSISRIGRWPCGQITLYVDSKKSKGSGVYAENFVCID